MVTAKTDMVTLSGRTDVAHIPYQPFWLLIIRGVQLLLAVLILGLSAYAGGGYYLYAGYGIGIFSFVWTLLFIGYIEVSTFYFPVAYNKYVHLVLEVLGVIFWLSTFGSLASIAAAWTFVDAVTTCAYGVCGRGVYSGDAYINSTKAAAALGAIEWVLFVGTLITFSIYLHRFRRAQMEFRVANPVGPAPAVVEEHKMQPVVNQQPVQQYSTYQQQSMA